jgi:NADPH2:quinone reductase
MKAMLCKEYGPPESLELSEIESEPVGSNQVRIGVHAAGLNFPD